MMIPRRHARLNVPTGFTMPVTMPFGMALAFVVAFGFVEMSSQSAYANTPTTAPKPSAAAVVDTRWPNGRAIFELGLGVGVGFGGWTDQAVPALGEAPRTVQHSIMGGFVGTIAVGAWLDDEFGAMFRFGMGGGAFVYSQPTDGPETGFSLNRPTKSTVYGRFSVGGGVRVRVPIADGLEMAGQTGPLLVIPLVETWTYRRETENISMQEHEITYTLGAGWFFEWCVLWAVEPQVSLRLGLVVEIAHVAWQKLTRQRGRGAYAPTGPSTFTGTFRYAADAEPNPDPPTADGFFIIRPRGSDGPDGLQAMLAFTLGFVVTF